MDDLELLRRLRADTPPPSPTAKAAARARLDAMIDAAEAEQEDVVTYTDEVPDMTQTQLPTRQPTEQPTAPRPRWLGVAAALLALAVATGTIVYIVSARDDSTPIVDDPAPDDAAPDQAPGPGGSSPDVVTTSVGAFPQDLAFAAGSLWVSNHGGGGLPSSLMRLDPDSLEVVETIAPPAGTRFLCWLETGADDSVISTVCGSGDRDLVARVDPATNEYEVLYTLDGFATAAAQYVDGELWVLDDPGTPERAVLKRVDVASGEVTTIDLGVAAPRATTLGFGSLWIASYAQPDLRSPRVGEVLRIDLQSGEIVARLPVDDASARLPGGGRNNGPTDIEATDEGIYVAMPGEGAIIRIDPATDAVTGRVSIMDERADSDLPNLGAGPDGLYTRLPDGTVYGIALGTLELSEPIALDAPSFSGDIAVTSAYVFVAQQEREGQITRLER